MKQKISDFYRLCRIQCGRRISNRWIDKALCTSILFLLVSIASLTREKAETICFKQNLASFDSLGFLPTLFMTIGASIVGVLAISFSLSLFSLQQAADKHTPQMLTEFLNDRVSRLAYWVLALIAVAFFLMPFLVPASCKYWLILTCGVLLFLVFWILRQQFFHIARLINPQFLIVIRHNRSIQTLDNIDQEINRLVDIGAIQHGPSNPNE